MSIMSIINVLLIAVSLIITLDHVNAMRMSRDMFGSIVWFDKTSLETADSAKK